MPERNESTATTIEARAGRAELLLRRAQRVAIVMHRLAGELDHLAAGEDEEIDLSPLRPLVPDCSWVMFRGEEFQLLTALQVRCVEAIRQATRANPEAVFTDGELNLVVDSSDEDFSLYRSFRGNHAVFRALFERAAGGGHRLKAGVGQNLALKRPETKNEQDAINPVNEN